MTFTNDSVSTPSKLSASNFGHSSRKVSDPVAVPSVKHQPVPKSPPLSSSISPKQALTLSVRPLATKVQSGGDHGGLVRSVASPKVRGSVPANGFPIWFKRIFTLLALTASGTSQHLDPPSSSLFCAANVCDDAVVYESVYPDDRAKQNLARDIGGALCPESHSVNLTSVWGPAPFNATQCDNLKTQSGQTTAAAANQTIGQVVEDYRQSLVDHTNLCADWLLYASFNYCEFHNPNSPTEAPTPEPPPKPKSMMDALGWAFLFGGSLAAMIFREIAAQQQLLFESSSSDFVEKVDSLRDHFLKLIGVMG